jgi:hypothetical protein
MATVPSQKRKAQDPDSNVPRLLTVVDRVLEGDVVLPKFQRNFVWTRQQILDRLHDGLAAVREYLEHVWGEAAARFRLLAENTSERAGRDEE